MTSVHEHRTAWLARLLSTEPADRAGAASAVPRLDAAAGFAEPRHIIWFDSPFEASWAVALLSASHHGLWTDRLTSGLSRQDRPHVARATAALVERTGAALPQTASPCTAGGRPRRDALGGRRNSRVYL